MRPAASAASIGVATVVAGLVTLATRSGWVRLSQLAATPKGVADGKIWLLFTSGAIADRPWLPSLVGFAIVGFAALSLAEWRVVVLAALAGHVLATLAVYGLLGVAGALDDRAFASLVDEGRRVRLSGQDARRGTFTHRHATLFDSKSGARYTPLAILYTEYMAFVARPDSELKTGRVLVDELARDASSVTIARVLPASCPATRSRASSRS